MRRICTRSWYAEEFYYVLPYFKIRNLKKAISRIPHSRSCEIIESIFKRRCITIKRKIHFFMKKECPYYGIHPNPHTTLTIFRTQTTKYDKLIPDTSKLIVMCSSKLYPRKQSSLMEHRIFWSTLLSR